MSVIVKGMKIPDCCFRCPFKKHYGMWVRCIFTRQNVEPEIRKKTKASSCPLVEVPPHGRLIDADAYRKEIRERYESAREWYNEAEDDEIIGRAEATMITFTECSLTLQNMPTIIESDIDVMYYPQVDGITPTVIKGEAEGCEDG